MPSPARVLFLEVDAGDRQLIRRWAADGTLPVFRRLLQQGLVGDTMSLEGFFVGSIWPSLYTAVNPAKHGIHSLLQLRPGTYDFYYCDPGKDVKRQPFWNFLSRAGQRVAVLDVPLSGLSEEINGIQSVEWGTHDSVYGFHASPPEFEAEVRERFGLHPWAESCNHGGRPPEEVVKFRDALVEGVRRKTELTRHYLGQGGWDFFCQVFSESHCVGHQCWHLHDPGHPGYDPAITAITGDPMRDVYRAIDAGIGEILELVDEDTYVVVLAGHRMSHKYGAQFLLPEILRRLGVAVLPESSTADVALGRLDNVLTWGWQKTPGLIKEPLLGMRARLRGWLDERGRGDGLPPTVSSICAEESQVFLVDNGFPVSALRLNLKGREPSGLIEPGAEQEDFCNRLARDLLDLVEADSGKPMVKAVKRTADLYAGEYLDHLPDLLVMWDDAIKLGSATCGSPGGSTLRVRSDRIGVVEGSNLYCRSGDHRPEGMFIATGPGIGAGELGRTVSIMDFAPTFCALLDVEMPDVDGMPVEEIAQARDNRS